MPSNGSATSRFSPRQIARAALGAVIPKSYYMTHGGTRSKSVYLTFDDGPHPQRTPAILAKLSNLAIKATFFLIGQRVEESPELVRDIVREGHAIGNHTWSHIRPSDRGAKPYLAEVQETRKLLESVSGTKTNLFRPPFGDLTARSLFGLWRHGYRIVLWNYDPRDYKQESPQMLVDYFESTPPTTGDVILMHDDRQVTVDSIDPIIESVRGKGYSFSRIDD